MRFNRDASSKATSTGAPHGFALAATKAKAEVQLPKGVEVTTTYDRSTLILETIHNVRAKLLEELVILLFLWHLPSALAQVFGKAGRADTPTDPAPLSMMETTILLRPTSEWRRIPRWYSGCPTQLCTIFGGGQRSPGHSEDS